MEPFKLTIIGSGKMMPTKSRQHFYRQRFNEIKNLKNIRIFQLTHIESFFYSKTPSN